MVTQIARLGSLWSFCETQAAFGAAGDFCSYGHAVLQHKEPIRRALGFGSWRCSSPLGLNHRLQGRAVTLTHLAFDSDGSNGGRSCLVLL